MIRALKLFAKGAESMRAVLIAAAAAALLPVPALAQGRPDDSRRISRELHDPATQAVAAGATEAMAGAVLETPIAPLLRAAKELAGEDPRDVPADLRLGDIVPPEAADAPHQFARQLPRTMNAMADMSDALADLTARLAAIGQAARAAVPDRY
jgi:hypothetical protein